MDILAKVNTFEYELNFIKNNELKVFAKRAIESLPDYFFEIPASSTGKYHPQYALNEGGLLRHTKACVRIAVELFKTDLWKFTEDEKDLILIGLMVHDGFKSGKNHEKYTRTDHPLVIAQEIAENKELGDFLDEKNLNFVLDNVKTHMGKWTLDHDGNQVLSPPKSIAQRFTHLVDYIASRKCLEFNFLADIIRE